MKIIVGKPPNFEAIDAVLHIRRQGRKPLAICYGDTIYQPSMAWDMPADYIHHESVHMRQQAKWGVEPWWNRYLANPQFMLEQELEAYRSQWRNFLEGQPSRPMRRDRLKHIVRGLSGPTYGHMISANQAKREVTGGDDE